MLTVLCYSYQTVSVNLSAPVLDTIYFISETLCGIEFHNVIICYVKKYIPLFILNLSPDRI